MEDETKTAPTSTPATTRRRMMAVIVPKLSEEIVRTVVVLAMSLSKPYACTLPGGFGSGWGLGKRENRKINTRKYNNKLLKRRCDK